MKTDLNQSEFGALGRVTKTAQLNYEKGERSPDAEYLMALLSHGVDVHYLLTGVRADQAGEGITAEQATVLTLFSSISDDRKPAAVVMLEALAAVSK